MYFQLNLKIIKPAAMVLNVRMVSLRGTSLINFCGVILLMAFDQSSSLRLEQNPATGGFDDPDPAGAALEKYW